MRKVLAAILVFGLGVIVGTSGSDDTLLKQVEQRAQSAYERGYSDAMARAHATAFQAGCGNWQYDPQSRTSKFVWRRMSHESEPWTDSMALIPIAVDIRRPLSNR